MTHTHHPGFLHMFPVKIDRKHYVEFFIWDTAENMRAAHPGQDGGFYGLASSCTSFLIPHAKKIVIPHKFGQINLIEEGYGSETVAHEIMHIMIFWVQIKHWDLDLMDERIAEICGLIHKAFWKKHYELYPAKRYQGFEREE